MNRIACRPVRRRNLVLYFPPFQTKPRFVNSPADSSMLPDPKIPAASDNPVTNGGPMASQRPVPPVITDARPRPAGKAASVRNFAAVSLSLCLGVFLAGGVISLLDDSLVLFWGRHGLTAVSTVLTLISFFLLLLIYGLMGLTPIIPKRVFLPVVFFTGLGLLAVFPVLIYRHNQLLQLDWLLSFFQVALILGIIYRLQRGSRFHWFVVEARHLGRRRFSWLNLSVFLLVNLFVLLPGLAAYLAVCTSLAVSHFTDGFLALRPGGLILQSRKYVRADGKTILLFPMSHIAEADFYQAVSRSVASNAVVLLEGVTDDQNLLTNRLSYRRAAQSLGLAEQHTDLNIRQGELVRADVDVHVFSTNTIAMLNLVALVHSRGLNPGTLSLLLECSPTPEAEQELFADLLLKRNEHLLKELRARLPAADNFVIPWGAAHMPGLAAAIQQSGFRLVETRDYVSIRFGSKRSQGSRSGEAQAAENSR